MKIYKATFPYRDTPGSKRRWGLQLPYEGSGILLAYGSSQRVIPNGLSRIIVDGTETLAKAGLVVDTRFELASLFLFEPGAGRLEIVGTLDETPLIRSQMQWLARQWNTVFANATKVSKMEVWTP